MNWLDAFAPDIRHDVPLGQQTWFRLGGVARHMASPRDVRQLGALLRRAGEAGMPVKVLGAGANILIRDAGFDGLVIRLDAPAFRRETVRGSCIRVGAGVDLMPFVRRTSEQGLAGVEGLAGVPGTIGGAVFMNAGGRYGDIGDVVTEIEVLDRAGNIGRLTREQIGFGYRCSGGIGDRVVVSATIDLHEENPVMTGNRFAQYFDEKKRSQPLADHSAGCIFKNPPGASAGKLIDDAGLKGETIGGASVSDQHANFIVGRKGATATDVLQLIDRIRDRVHREWGTDLEVEIDIW